MLKKRTIVLILLILILFSSCRNRRLSREQREVQRIVGTWQSDHFEPPAVAETPVDKKIRVETAYYEIILKQEYHFSNYEILSDCNEFEESEIDSSVIGDCDKFDSMISDNSNLLTSMSIDEYLFKSFLVSNELCEVNDEEINQLIIDLKIAYDFVLSEMPLGSDSKLIRSFAFFMFGNGKDMTKSAIQYYDNSPSEAMQLACKDSYNEFEDCSSATECCEVDGEHKRGSKYVQDIFDVYREFCSYTDGFFLTSYNPDFSTALAVDSSSSDDTSTKVQEAIDVLETNNIFESDDIENNREIMKPVLTSLSVQEAEEFIQDLKEKNQVKDLIISLTKVSPDAEGKDALYEHLEKIYESGKIDFLIETLNYVNYDTLGEGTYYAHPTVSIHDYSAVNTQVIVHETCHGFNEKHASGELSGISGGNEGTCIALAKYYAGEEVNLAETVFGTVLYYRDIGLEGYPENIPIGDFNQYDAKGKDMLDFLMSVDESNIDWTNTEQVNTIFDNYWVSLNRDQEWSAWLADVSLATQSSVAYVNTGVV